MMQQEILDTSAIKLQALARGVAGRTRFKKMAPLLRRAKQARTY